MPAPAVETAPGRSPTPWGIPAILVALAVPVLLWSLGLFTDTPEDPGTGEVVVGLIGTILLKDVLFVALVGWLAVRRYRAGWRSIGLGSFDRSLWWWPVPAVIGAYLGILAYGGVLFAFGVDPPDQNLDYLFESRIVLPLTAVAVVALAPLSEEIFFRGFIFTGLIRPLGISGAMLASGLLFGVFHVSGLDTLGLLVPFTLIGALLAWLYQRTGSLWPSIATHLLFNTVGFVAGVSTATVGPGLS